MKIIDAHLHFAPERRHFSRLALRAGHENTEEGLRKAFAESGIAGGLVMGAPGMDADETSFPGFLRYLVGVDASQLTGDRESVSHELADIQKNLERKDCVGIKLYPGYSYHYVCEPIYDPVFDLAKAYQKPVAVHTGQTVRSDALLKYSHPLTLDEAAVRHPDVQIVMCHLGNPFLSEAAAVLEKNRNVSADLSGLLEGRIELTEYLSRLSGYVEMLKSWIAYVEDYSRFLFGTDWPLVNHDEYIGFIKAIIPEEHWDAVFFENARRIYHLEDAFT